MLLVRLWALRKHLLYCKETNLDFIYLSCWVFRRATLRREIKSMKNSNIINCKWTRDFGFVRQCLIQMHHHVPPFNIRLWRTLHLNNQPLKCKFMVGNGASFEVRPDRLWDAVLCVKVVVRWNWGKMLQSVPVHNSDTLRDMYCDVYAFSWLHK